ncbi:GntR family transcriptional regulator [Vagococcus acidifermentans]|uniref:HTH gntR-type domain-containing protein n=1 Tax=Vagococcus acidifermentans TaxID=564710 RepID=A0A430AMZ5_9ENTE|nr:GntR family transcriptional regulator [Vagococcus acidifermentans]RSU09530.1 hypothetical protein CBF27_12540 [Vagococcus acidifermentans]
MKTKKLLYIEIAADIKEDILSGVYEVDSYIPTEIELEEKYQVSKITVRKAVDILVQEGYLVKKSGKGTRVISNRAFNKLSKAVSFSHILENMGHKLEKKVIALEEVDPASTIPEVKKMGTHVVKLTRMYLLDNEPYILFDHYLPNAGNLAELKKDKTSLYSWLTKQGTGISYIKDAFSVETASEEVKQALQLKGDIVLKRTRHSYNATNKLVEYSIGHYDTMKKLYEIEYEI